MQEPKPAATTEKTPVAERNTPSREAPLSTLMNNRDEEETVRQVAETNMNDKSSRCVAVPVARASP